MSEKEVKVVVYEPKAFAKHPRPGLRWCVVDFDGNVVDDANGYGYTSVSSAVAYWNYQVSMAELYDKDIEIWNWCDSNKQFKKAFEVAETIAFEDGDKLTFKTVEGIIDKLKVKPPYAPIEIYRVWGGRKPRKPNISKDYKKL